MPRAWVSRSDAALLRVLRPALLLLSIAGCSPAPPGPTVRGRDLAISPAPQEMPSSTPAPSVTAASPSPAPVRHDDVYPPSAAVDPRAWAAAHGASWPPRGILPKAGLRAWDISGHVGIPPAPGLICETPEQSATTKAHVLRLEGHRLRVVWSGIIATHGWLHLTVLPSPDGTDLIVGDFWPDDCDCALDHYSAKEANGVDPGFGDILLAGCKGRGTYPWTGTSYARPAGISGLGKCPSTQSDKGVLTIP